MRARWSRLSLRVPKVAVDRAVAELWSLGTVGLEQHPVEDSCLIHAYFASSAVPQGADVRGFWASLEGHVESVESVVESDWLEEYRRHAKVFPLGRRFFVDPREPGLPHEDDGARLLLRLPARQAFGTGSHESTRLVVEWLEGQNLEGLTVLDVGTGTGVLAVVALRLGAPRVVAVEIDPAAGFMAHLNQALNRTSFPLVIGGVAAIAAAGYFDLAMINVIPLRIADDLGRLAVLVRPGGFAVFSGHLRESSGEVSERLRRSGFAERERLFSHGWGALVVEREAV
jgi:ribosomal protein L11 methyltransferase